MKQGDLFEHPDASDEDRPPVLSYADPAKVSVELNRLLDEMRAASSMPWDAYTVGYHQLVFPQMSRWLPEDEAAQLCLAFEEELKRLEAAA
jgi:hypothetical protein